MFFYCPRAILLNYAVNTLICPRPLVISMAERCLRALLVSLVNFCNNWTNLSSFLFSLVTFSAFEEDFLMSTDAYLTTLLVIQLSISSSFFSTCGLNLHNCHECPSIVPTTTKTSTFGTLLPRMPPWHHPPVIPYRERFATISLFAHNIKL